MEETRKFYLNVGHIIIICIFVVGQAVSFWGLSLRYENRLSRMEDVARTTTESVDKLTALVHYIDENGTHKSQQGIQAEAILGAANARRLDTQEGAMAQLVPKVERMNTNLDWLVERARDEKGEPKSGARP